MTDLQERAAALYKGEALAPMVRASTTPLRTLALRYGADLVYTEELVDRSVTSTTRIENEQLGCIDYVKDTSQLSGKHRRRLAQTAATPALLLRIDRRVEGGKLVCQIGSGEPELALAAARHVHRDVDAVDVNMGCPKKFSVSGGMGSALLSDPDRACRIVRTLSNGLATVPVSAKVRLLKDAASTVDFVSALINAGAKAVAIHGRRVGHAEQRAADWETLEEVVSLAKSRHPSTPVLINGDFYTRSEFTDFQKKTGANGVLLARPALYNTSIFRKPSVLVGGTEITSASHGYQSPLLLDKTIVIQDYLKEAIKYDYHYKNIKYVTCEMMNSRRAPSNRVPFLPQTYPGGQTIGKICSSRSLADICRVWEVDYDAAIRLRNTGSGPALAAGEHKYSDEYLRLKSSPAVDTEHLLKEDSPNPPSKRVRVES